MAETPAHRDHDRFAVAASIGDATVPSMVVRCPSCRALHGDLGLLRDAVRLAMFPRRMRDCRLDAAMAASLRGTRWRRLVGWLGSPNDLVSGPLGGAVTSLGLAGLLLAGVTVWSAAPATDLGGERAVVAADAGSRAVGPLAPSAGARTGAGGADDTKAPDAALPPIAPLVELSMAMLAAGGGILVLRRLSPGNRRAREVVQRTT